MGCLASQPLGMSEKLRQAVEVDFHNAYLIGAKLGQGAFAQVRMATQVSLEERPEPVSPKRDAIGAERIVNGCKQAVAVKIVNLREEDRNGIHHASLSLQKVARQEVTIWRVIGENPNCVNMHDAFYGSRFCYMVMEKCRLGLQQHLETMSDLNERTLGHIFAQMLLGICHCHKVNVIHRDIKPDNFVLGGEQGNTVKLADFGFSALLPKRGKVKGIFGTGPYMCPEMLAGEWYDGRADVWSFGVIVYALLFGALPYQPRTQPTRPMWQAIVEGGPLSFKPHRQFGDAPHGLFRSDFRSDDAVHAPKMLLNRDPKSRPSAEDALGLPWMVASLEGIHLPDEEDLPSLEPMLRAAKKVGAFDIYDATCINANDLAIIQMQRQRQPLRTEKKNASSEKDSTGNWESISNRSTACGSSSSEWRWSNPSCVTPNPDALALDSIEIFAV